MTAVLDFVEDPVSRYSLNIFHYTSMSIQKPAHTHTHTHTHTTTKTISTAAEIILEIRILSLLSLIYFGGCKKSALRLIWVSQVDMGYDMKIAIQ